MTTAFHTAIATGAGATAALFNARYADLDEALTRLLDESENSRATVALTNKSGGTLTAGDVVVVDTSTNSACTTTATAGDTDVLGVVETGGTADALVRVCVSGLATVAVAGTTSRGQFLKTSTTAKSATPTSSLEQGVFAIALTASASAGAGTVTALLFGGPMRTGAPDAHKASHQDGGSDEISVAGLSGVLADAQTPTAHKASHQDGGSDEISLAGLSGEAADAQKVAVRKNSGANVGSRARLNLIEGSNVTLSVTDDAGDGEVEITITSTASSGTPDDDSVTGAKLSPDAVFGASSQKLSNYVPYSSSYDLLRIDSASDSSFSALINGTPSGTSVAYDTVVGNEDSIVPVATTQIGKLVLRNTTRGTSALISSVNTSTNTITVTSADDISGWADNDVITVNSATCIAASAPYYFDLDLSGFLPSTAVAVIVSWAFKDTGTAGAAIGILHPYEAFADMKTKTNRSQLAGAWHQTGADAIVPIISRKVCICIDASGSSTASILMRISGWFEQAAT